MTCPETNPIGFLQEQCQKFSYRFPKYEEIDSSGPDHSREFTFKCTFEGFEAFGQSRQKKQAKSESAKAVIDLIKKKGNFDKLTNGILDDVDSVNTKAELGKLKTPEEKSQSINPISAINEYCQKTSLSPPQFKESSVGLGSFVCECKVMGKKTYGHGTNKKTAKTEAAVKMCIELNIKSSGADGFLQESQVKENDFETEKNPISVLQELYNQNDSLKTLEYTELQSVGSVFVVKCSLDSISCEGRGSTKKMAKTEAAKRVLEELTAQNIKSDRSLTGDSSLSKIIQLSVPVRPYKPSSNLEDFSLSSDEDDEGQNKKAKANLELSKDLEALSIEDNNKLIDSTTLQNHED